MELITIDWLACHTRAKTNEALEWPIKKMEISLETTSACRALHGCYKRMDGWYRIIINSITVFTFTWQSPSKTSSVAWRDARSSSCLASSSSSISASLIRVEIRSNEFHGDDSHCEAVAFVDGGTVTSDSELRIFCELADSKSKRSFGAKAVQCRKLTWPFMFFQMVLKNWSIGNFMVAFKQVNWSGNRPCDNYTYRKYWTENTQ